MAEDTAFAQAVAAEEDEQIKIAAGEGLDNLFQVGVGRGTNGKGTACAA
jgi:hypothetical protein